MSKKVQDMNILVIEDEPKICELVKVFLETSFNFKSVITSPSVVLGSQKLANQEFDLLILDHNLPGKTGVEYLIQLRGSIKFGRLKILLISGYLQEEDAIAAIKAGVKNILVKPFNKQQLADQVADILKIQQEP